MHYDMQAVAHTGIGFCAIGALICLLGCTQVLDKPGQPARWLGAAAFFGLLTVALSGWAK